MARRPDLEVLMPARRGSRAGEARAGAGTERLIEALALVMSASTGAQPMVDVLRRLHARGVDVTSSEVGAAVK